MEKEEIIKTQITTMITFAVIIFTILNTFPLLSGVSSGIEFGKISLFSNIVSCVISTLILFILFILFAIKYLKNKKTIFYKISQIIFWITWIFIVGTIIFFIPAIKYIY